MRNKKRDFRIFESFPYYTPGVSGCFAIFGWFLLGTALGSIITAVFTAVYGQQTAIAYGMIVAYPVMFIPAMMYCASKSKRNAFFETGISLDNAHFGPRGGLVTALLCILATWATGIVSEVINGVLPEMPDYLAELLGQMTGGNLWVDLLVTACFAAFFEEWLCRGEILRGLLNYRRSDGSRGLKPAWAIVISAAFFALIHGNIWQAVIAFLIGCLMGYVYYRTGSLRLTMLMHFTNNATAVILSHIDTLEGKDTWQDILGQTAFMVTFVLCLAFLVYFIYEISRIPLERTQGNFDELKVDF